MKRVLIVAVLVLALMLALVACGQKAAVEEASVPAQEEETASVANPWREVTQEEAQALCAKSFNVPEGAENVVWSVNDSVADASGVPGALVQVAFDLNGMSFTAREQVTGDTEIDNSGMNYQWTAQEEGSLSSWVYQWTAQEEGSLSSWVEGMTCKLSRFIGDGESADLCTWYDVETGISYSLSTVAADLDGFDIIAVAGAMAPTAEPME